jgi:hypothetical protein
MIAVRVAAFIRFSNRMDSQIRFVMPSDSIGQDDFKDLQDGAPTKTASELAFLKPSSRLSESKYGPFKFPVRSAIRLHNPRETDKLGASFDNREVRR